jgi:hypothetical protein
MPEVNMIQDNPYKYNRSEANVLGAKNLLILNDASDGNASGVDYTFDAKTGSITMDGTASNDAYKGIARLYYADILANKEIKFSVEPSTDFALYFQYWQGTSTRVSIEGSTDENGIKVMTPTFSNYDNIVVGIYVKKNKTVTNKTVYPMLRLASDPSDEWQPYAKTNRQLTTDKCENSVIANVENGATALKGYYKGEHFIRDGKFCTVTASISQGETLTEGSNYKARNVGNILEIFSRNTILEVSLNGGQTKTITFDGNASGYIFSMLTDSDGSIYYFGESANAIAPIVGSGSTNVLVTKPTTSSIQIKNNLSWSVHFFILSARGGATVTTS